MDSFNLVEGGDEMSEWLIRGSSIRVKRKQGRELIPKIYPRRNMKDQGVAKQ